LHFQFVACLLMALKRNKGNIRKLWPLWIMVAGLLAKIYLELNSGHVTDELVGGPIAFQAHRGGALGGIFAAYFLLMVKHFYDRDPRP
jgi:membrane associated rhomboid family serine protease